MAGNGRFVVHAALLMVIAVVVSVIHTVGVIVVHTTGAAIVHMAVPMIHATASHVVVVGLILLWRHIHDRR